jgi:steroid 5-alpha reductase family enzyme
LHHHHPAHQLLRAPASTALLRQRPLTAASFASAAAAASSSPAATSSMWLFGALGAAGGWVACDFLLQWGGWAISTLLKTEKYYDLFGTGTFAIVAVGSFLRSAVPHATAATTAQALSSSPHFARQAVATAMVACWALRLGSFLVHRVHSQGGDSRFDEAKHQPLRFWVFWTMQGAWVALTLLPVLLLNVSAAPAAAVAATRGLVWTDVAGPALWLAGFATEATADRQKAAFRADRANNAGRFVDRGLWSLAKFPNYGGEIAAWSGLALFCAGSGALSTPGALIACAASPAFVALLLLKVSGVPIQDKQAKERWGGQPEYEAWRARTNLLFPVPFALPRWLGGPDDLAGGARRPLAEGGDDDSDKTH